MLRTIIKVKCLFLALLFVCGVVSNAEANIVLKLVAVNPSKDQVQKVPVKAYLPKELKPEDIVDKGDLSITYDTQQGSYCVYAEYELKPGEVLEKTIEIKDIWIIPRAEIDSYRQESVKLAGLFKNTDFAERVSFLKKSVDSKLDQIIENQKNSPANPERHISDYRENLKILEAVKSDLVLARSMLSQIRPLPTAVVWNLIVGIVVFLGVLGLAFYFIWRRQFSIITKDVFTAAKPQEAGYVAKPIKRDSEGEGSTEPFDIEKIIEKKS